MPRRLFGALVLCASAGAASAITVSVELHVKTEGPASQPALGTAADGTPLLSWIETRPDGSEVLRFTRMGTRKWNDPVTLTSGDDWFINWADIPKLCSPADGRLIYGWLQNLGDDKYAYGVRFAVADAAGKTLGEPAWLHDDLSPTEHGFLSLAPFGVDRAWAVWLDGRRFADGQTAFGKPIPRREEMQLRAALLSSHGAKLREATLDARTCECCPTSLVSGPAGVFVAWRDRGADEVRNIAISKLDGLDFTPPRTLHDDQWKVPGCPVNGPVLALNGRELAAAWFTAPNDRPQIRFARGDVSTLQFTAPLRLDEREALGRVDLELQADGTAHLIWMSSLSGERAALLWTRIAPDGSSSEPETITTLDAARHSGLPQLALIDDAAIVVWTEGVGEQAKLRCLQLRSGGGR